MSEPTQESPNTLAASLSEQAQQALDQFRAAWQSAKAGDLQPDVDSFLDNAPEPERPILRSQLEQIAERFTRTLLDRAPGPGKDTVEAAGQTSGEAANASFDLDSNVGTPIAGPAGSGHSDPTRSYHPPQSGPEETPSVEDKRQLGRKKELPRVPGYEILGVLGHGGMGVVYKARQVRLKRLTALKMILAGAHATANQLARFHTEALAVARLQHPNIVQIYEVGEQDGLPYFSLEFVDGGPLDRRLDRKPQPPRDAAKLIENLARAVHFAHQHGVIHRDLKPANVLLTADGSPKITDFGLAKAIEEEDSAETRSGTILGTASYMAPEQARGEVKSLGPLVDVYALGAILYETLTGRPPFQGSTMMETIDQVRHREPVQPTQLQPAVPIDLETICLKCLQKEPTKRYAAALDLADDLRRFLSGEPILARPVSQAERLWRWCRRNPLIAIPSAATVVLLIVAVVILTWSNRRLSYEKALTEAAKQLADNKALDEEAARKDADQHAKVAETQKQLALDTLNAIVTAFYEPLKGRPDQQALRQTLFSIAEARIDKMIRSVDESKYDRTIAGLYQRRGDLLLDLARTEEASAQYQGAHRIVAKLAEATPDARNKQNLAIALERLGMVSLRFGKEGAARNYYQQGLQLRREVAELSPDNANAKSQVARAYGLLGSICLRMGDPVTAREYYLQSQKWQQPVPASALTTTESKRERAGLLDKFGEIGVRLGDSTEALKQFLQALEIRQALVDAEPPNQTVAKRDLAISFNNLGDVSLLLLRDPAAAAKYYDECLSLRLKLEAMDRQSAMVRGDVAAAFYRVATVQLALGNEVLADQSFRQCLERRQELAAASASDLHLQIELLLALARCGPHAEAAQRADKIRAQPGLNCELLYHLGCVYALCHRAVTNFAGKKATGSNDQTLARHYADSALRALRQMVSQGWSDVVSLQVDPDLETVRKHPEFEQLLKLLKQTSEP